MSTADKAFHMDDSTRIRFVAGCAITLGSVIGGAMMGGGHISSFLAYDPLLIVLAGVLLASVSGVGLSWRTGLGLAIATASTGPKDMSTQERLLLVRRLAASSKGAIVFMVIGLVFGLVHVMENLDKPEQIGPGIALAFLSGVFGVLLAQFFSAIRNNHTLLLPPQDNAQSDLESNVSLIPDAFGAMWILLFATMTVLFVLKKGA